MHKINSKRLKNWFLNEKRDLPWRNDPTPYAVWISEVMLQQTQVAVVIPYFEKWMLRFPSIESLAQAHQDEVIKLWEGLGYYSRARNIHEAARYIVKYHQGELPSTEEELENIKGLGPYTVGAILSFAFRKRAAAVDGNVIRVLSRHFHIEEDIAKNKTINHLRQLALEILPEEESWIQNEALIELGATICKKKPKCHECPLKAECKSHLHGSTDRIPFKSTKFKTHYLYRSVPVITCNHKLLIKRGQKGKIMSDLHEFPYFDTTEKGWSIEELQKTIIQDWNLKTQYVRELPEANHSFTKYQVSLKPVLLKSKQEIEIEGHQWLTLEEIQELAFSSGHRRILSTLPNDI